MGNQLKHRSEGSQRFYFNGSEVKQRSECSQIYHFSVTYATVVLSFGSNFSLITTRSFSTTSELTS